jgi:chorismate lyase/3-hydroxybenzoate synthase
LIAPDDTLLISGTASIVGHHSQHHDDAMEQLEETVRNLSSFAPHVRRPRSSNRGDLLKVYVRERELMPRIVERLRQLYPTSEILFVAADVCRRELLLEIEAISLAPQGS